MKLVVIDFKEFADKAAVHGFLKEQLSFPDYYGRNLDALYDVLTDISEDTTVAAMRGDRDFEAGFIEVMKAASEHNRHFVFVEIQPF